MIESLKCKETEKIWHGIHSKKLPADIQNKALRKLRQLNAAVTIDDLRNPPGNMLEQLKGDRVGQMSIRINNKWRICFIWHKNEVTQVNIVDYH